MHIIHLTTRATKKKVRVIVEQILSYMPVHLDSVAKGTDVSMATGVSISVLESAEDIDDMMIRHGVLVLEDDGGKPADVIRFGKYNGRTVESVIQENPRYIVWAYENVEGRGGISDQQYLKAGGTLPKPLSDHGLPKPMHTPPMPKIAPPRSAPAARDFGDDFADDDIPF